MSASKFWNRDISSASEKAFSRFFCHFFDCSIPSKRGVSVHKNSVASCQLWYKRKRECRQRQRQCQCQRQCPRQRLLTLPVFLSLSLSLSCCVSFLHWLSRLLTLPLFPSLSLSLLCCVSFSHWFSLITWLWHTHKYTGGCWEQRKGIQGQGGGGAKQGWCVWRGCLVSSWSVSGAPTPRSYTTIHHGLWSAEYVKKSVRLKVGWAQLSTHICWWLINSVTLT